MAGARSKSSREATPATFLRRARAYAHATGVRFEPTPRHAGYGELGLPDVRGFTPHRRAVRRFTDETAEFPRADEADATLDDFTTSELWLLHDLLHVVGYDVATLHALDAGVGDPWARRDFFLEQHLASEALAVLLLDYHVLSATKHRGLAVEVSDDAWNELNTAGAALPPLRSRELASELLRHYLSGRSELLGPRPRGATSKRLAQWRDHEVSYSEKQRAYVWMWWSDLAGTKPTHRRAVVDDSHAFESLWRAIELFTTARDAEFAAHVDHAAAALRDRPHAFASLPKYAATHDDRHDAARGASRPLDFRFTDVLALDVDEALAFVRAAERPCAEHLFLLWQVVTLAPPSSLKPAEHDAVTRLARSVQTSDVDRRAWKLVRELAERRLARARWRADPTLRAAFFLP